MSSSFPTYVPLEVIIERLPIILPEGTPNRNYCIREIAAKTIFAMIYVGAVEGHEHLCAPHHIYKMTDEQSMLSASSDRQDYREKVRRGIIPGNKWYADTTREPIRDETLKEGFGTLGIVQYRKDVPTTSSKPRYWLSSHFVDLLNPSLSTEEFLALASIWQNHYLAKDALTRVRLAELSLSKSDAKVSVNLPNGEVRMLSAGPSSEISKAVIEVFANNYLAKPGLIWLSESGNKVIANDDRLATSIGLKIDASRNLPDIILVDLAPKSPLLVFIEVVATDGAINERRQTSIYEITDGAGFKRDQIVFVTAYGDRQSSGAKKTILNLAWNSFAWFYSEPENLVVLKKGAQKYFLSDFL